MRAAFDCLDIRIRRTRQMLHQALRDLLTEQSFNAISVQDIATRSTLNRATFYDHFTDKYALLEDTIGEDFRGMFASRMAHTAGTCCEGQKQLVLAVCDFLTELGKRCQAEQRQFAPLVEAKIKSLVRDFLVCCLRRENGGCPMADLELKATMASWAIYGAATEWVRNPEQCPELFAATIIPHITGILQVGEPADFSR